MGYAKVKNAGFTLMELMITVAVIGILVGIAYPNYLSYLRETRRADGKEALFEIHIQQEKWRRSNPAYTATLGDLGLGTESNEKYYSLALSNNSATGYTAKATAQGVQASDIAECKVLEINEDGIVGSESHKRQCWR